MEIVVEAEDETSDIWYVAITFCCEETGKTLYVEATGIYNEERFEFDPYPDGKWRGTLCLDRWADAGTYRLDYISVYDYSGQSSSYYWNPVSAYDNPLPGQLKDLRLEVINNNPQDQNPPVLQNVTLSTTTVSAPGLVEGDERNLKVTTPMDLKIAEMLLEE